MSPDNEQNPEHEPAPLDETLPIESLERIDQVARDFEDRLKLGERPVIEDVASGFEGAERAKLIDDLVALEWHYRLEETHFGLSSEYRGRFDSSVVERALKARTGTVPSKPRPVEERPEAVGPYRVLDVLGEGGMGTVYLAEQTEPIRRRVALKLIKPGMGSKEVVARFEAERQALAVMDHPNIARVYDAGTTDDGRPYFVMEHVRGVPLDEYCDRHRLGLRDRLTLFTQVCDGVGHAHHRGIIHRDLKPSNVLVSTPDEKPVAKIIDFGVARATNQRLTEKTLYTEIGRVVGTPAYMSPEQAEMTGEDVDHRTDVYSLGVMLYELLVGELPLEPEALQKAAFDEIIRRIREDDPPTPSTRWTRLNAERVADLARRRRTGPGEISSAIRGDLDWITMQALEKDRERRYSTAGHLSEDVGRFLAGDPVEAGPPGLAYRITKYVRKNRVPATAVLVVFLTVLVGAGAVVVVQSLANARLEVANTTLEERNTTISEQALELQESNTTVTRQASELKAERDQVLRLADVKRLEDLLSQAEELWPCLPEKAEAMRTWLDRAEALFNNRPIHEVTLLKLREDAMPYGDEQRAEDRRTHPKAQQLAEARHQRQDLEKEAEAMEKPRPDRKATLITYADDAEKRPVTVSFRHSFELEDPSAIEKLSLSATIDDGCVVYLNGVEVHRSNMPEGEVSAATPSESCKKDDPPTLSGVELGKPGLSTLRKGANSIAVEVHNCSLYCSDLRFDLSLAAAFEIVPAGSEWRYHDGTSELLPHWKDQDFDDSSWKTGPSPLGYGFSGELGKAIELERIEQRIEKLEVEVSTRRTWKFADDETDWQHRTLAGLVAGFETLGRTVADVKDRLEFSESVEKLSVIEHHLAWEDAIRSIADESECPIYGGLRLKQQLGLVPIGRDPDSGLWEFAHVQSGEIPKRDETTGKLIRVVDMSFVFVLIPGGTFRMGAERPAKDKRLGFSVKPMEGLSPNVDPDARSDESPVHEVTLDPFFLSKFEMTQGQWERFTGQNPSAYKNPLNPIETVGWNMCAETLRRLDLELPTEAQLEYATRAGTSTVWWTGNERDLRLGKANLADLTAKRAGAPQGSIECPELHGDKMVHAPVGSFPANPWGLHEVHGNLSEYCRDWWGSYSYGVRERDGLRRVPSTNFSHRVGRGGGIGYGKWGARSAERSTYQPWFRYVNVGLRPARAIDR